MSGGSCDGDDGVGAPVIDAPVITCLVNACGGASEDPLHVGSLAADACYSDVVGVKEGV